MRETVLTSKTEVEEILTISPEWRAFLARAEETAREKQSRSRSHSGSPRESPPALALLEQVGAEAIYTKAKLLGAEQGRFLDLIRDFYFQPMFARMLTLNQNLKRFWIQRRVDRETQERLCVSLSTELALKLHTALIKQMSENKEDGFKVLLPAYAQRSVHNAVVDYVRSEWQWERDTLQDLDLDPSQVDPRTQVADQAEYSPEYQAISSEQVKQLNEVRAHLSAMLGDQRYPQDALIVVDCMFGLGLTPHSRAGEEMTMRECCEKLSLKGDTQARQIARCQVLLDKGLDMIREAIRTSMPGVAHAWQADVNVNSASRRELNHYLGLTEGEVDRLLPSRQYYYLEEMAERKVVKQERIPEIAEKGAVAAFIPVDLNSATRRDIIDICGADKTAAKKLVEKRPFDSLEVILKSGILDQAALDRLIAKGAVLKVQRKAAVPLNTAGAGELAALGLERELTKRILRGRPFQSWTELEQFIEPDPEIWRILREKACLS